MFSEVCIPRKVRCLRAPCLYSERLVVLQDHTNHVYGVAAIMYRRERGPWCFGWKLDSEDTGERSGTGYSGDPLAHGEGPGLSIELLDQELGPCEVSNED